jgi:tetraacyldisaccharide 4'-kinase
MTKQQRLLTLPFSWIYGLITAVRNKLYDAGLLKSATFDLPVICVGNLVVGGAGKTPVTEYLVALLKEYKIAVLSRGYGRETRGFIQADKYATAASIGDEPMQYYTKFDGVTVAVCEDRVEGIRRLKANHDLIILDDAFQHRRVRAGLNILLFEFSTLIRRQFLLPAGNLREYFSNYRRADMILVTKVPPASIAAQKKYCREKFDLREGQTLSFSQISYHELRPVFNMNKEVHPVLSKDTTVFLLTGIANPIPLLDYLGPLSATLVHHRYGDHYQFSTGDIQQLLDAFHAHPAKEKIVITTEKDTQRLLGDSIRDLLVNLPLFYLPIKIEIQEEDKVTFDQKIINYVSSAAGNR